MEIDLKEFPLSSKSSSAKKPQKQILLSPVIRTGADLREGFFIMIKSHFGLSILTLPYAATRCGIVPAVALIFIINRFLTRTMNMLCEAAIDLPFATQTFGNVTDLYFGSRAAQFINILLALGSLGTCVAYLMFFHTFTNYFFAYFNTQLGVTSIFIITILFTLPFSMLRTVHALSSFTKYTFFLCAAILLINILHNTMQLLGGTTSQDMRFFHIGELVELYGIILAIYPYIIFFGVRNALAKPELHLELVINYSNYVSLITQIMFAVSFSLVFAYDQILEIALYNMPKNQFFSFLVLLYGFTLLINFPITLNSAIQSMEIQFNTGVYNTQVAPEWLPRRSVALRLALVAIISIIAFIIPSLSIWLSSIGLIKANIFSVLFPLVVHYQQKKHSLQRSNIIEYCILGFIGVIGLILGLFQLIGMFL